MKSFFKKLAFVMALAMVVTLAAPAAKTAVAAEAKELAIGYQTGMAITEVNLAKVGDTEDLRFLYAPENWKELGVKWTSSNENVVTVDNSGLVTAVAEGSAIVSVAVGTETATVTVNVVDLPTYTATMGTADDRNMTEATLEVEESIDLAFYGIKDYSRDLFGNGTPRYFCEWTSTDETVATVDTKGLVTAVAPGKAKITLVVWNLKLNIKHNVDACWITVPEVEPEATPAPVDIVAELNKTQNTIEVTFPEATTIGLADVEMYRVFSADDDNNGDGVIDARDAFEPYQDFYVYDAKPNTAKTVYTLITFDDFTDGATYEVRVNGYEPERFVASVGDVAKVEVYEKSSATLASEEGDVDATPATLAVKLYDAKGVNVTTRVVNGIANNDVSNISYELVTESSEYSLFYDEILFYENAVANVKAIYDNNDVAQPLESTPIAVRPSKTASYNVDKVVAWTVVNQFDDNDKINWNGDLKKTVPADESDYVIVTLLKDTRGNYFSTHTKGTGDDKYVDENGVKHDVLHTEDEAAFWINGYYVEYKAMSPDKMLVETDGRIESYEKGTARFALYLYDYNKQTVDGFVRELYSQTLTVCHPKQLDNFVIDGGSDLDLMMKTEEENGVSNAYYSLYSKGNLTVVLKDIHGYDAKAEHAREAHFEVKLTTDADNEGLADALKVLIEDVLNGVDTVKRTANFAAVDFETLTDKGYIKFRLTETTTKKYVNVTITLRQPAEIDEVDGVSAKVHTVVEYQEDMGEQTKFEKFVASTGNFTVEQAITDYKNDASVKNNGYNILLKQVDKKNNPIGIDSNLYIATSTNKTLTVDDIVDVDGNVATGSSLKLGDRVITVKTPEGKIFNIGEVYKNPVYSAKAQNPAPLDTTDLGAEIKSAGTATDETGNNTTSYNQYGIVFRTVDGSGEVIYAKNGRYTITIQTVESVDADGNIRFATAMGLKDTIYATVKNSNKEVSYAGRNEIRLEGYAENVSAQDILDAFDFKLGNDLWAETDSTTDGKLDATDILEFTYTIAATNNQVVINTVTFKVPVMGTDNKTDNANRYGWYRSTVTVNKSITFE